MSFHRGVIDATARSPIAGCPVIESLLRRQYIGFIAMPNLQCRLLNGAAK
jgi:hypothetical protein